MIYLIGWFWLDRSKRFRVIDSKSFEIRNLNEEDTIKIVESGRLANMAYNNGELITTNGVMQRYFIDNQNKILLLYQLMNGTKKVGFVVVNKDGIIKTVRESDIVKSRIMMCNGKIVDKHVSSIQGEIEKIDIKEYQKRLANSNTNIQDVGTTPANDKELFKKKDAKKGTIDVLHKLPDIVAGATVLGGATYFTAFRFMNPALTQTQLLLNNLPAAVVMAGAIAGTRIWKSKRKKK